MGPGIAFAGHGLACGQARAVLMFAHCSGPLVMYVFCSVGKTMLAWTLRRVTCGFVPCCRPVTSRRHAWGPLLPAAFTAWIGDACRVPPGLSQAATPGRSRGSSAVRGRCRLPGRRIVVHRPPRVPGTGRRGCGWRCAKLSSARGDVLPAIASRPEAAIGRISPAATQGERGPSCPEGPCGGRSPTRCVSPCLSVR